ncbi:MAG: DNA-3-methyladenine glycosylase I [Erysipelotrichaceae bacterium]|jgi:DNA-3-methyladenine glycosylase I|nr:DNA-3-methyladenine glycosylase I [Erysipelotrichaceae bacterium]
MAIQRCEWAHGSQAMLDYHDHVWGVPVHDDRTLFEFLILEGFQAGLSWSTILNKQENFRKAFDNWDIEKVAHYDEGKISSLLQDPGIVRNRLKIKAAITNAQGVLNIQKEGSTFDQWLWAYTGFKTIVHKAAKFSDLPTHDELSDMISRDLKKRGFRFVGTTIIYSFLQAVGIINDHLTSCYRYKEINHEH